MSKRNNVYKWILSSIVFLFLFIDGMSKFFQPKIVLKASEQIGFNANDIFIIGVIPTFPHCFQKRIVSFED